MISSLQVVYEALYGKGHPPKKENLTELSGILAGIAGRSNPWGWKYLANILKGYEGFHVSPELSQAIQMWGAVQDEQSPLLPLVREVRMFSVNGDIADSIVLGDKQFCPQCHVKFVPNVPWRKYCSDECKKAVR